MTINTECYQGLAWLVLYMYMYFDFVRLFKCQGKKIFQYFSGILEDLIVDNRHKIHMYIFLYIYVFHILMAENNTH